MPYRLFGHVSLFMVEFLRKLFQLGCPSSDEEGDTGSSLFSFSSARVLTYDSCACDYAGCNPFHPVFPNMKKDEQFGGKRVTPGLS